MQYPCLGLQVSHEPKIANYLSVCRQVAGGAASRHRLAMEQFGRPYSELEHAERVDIDQQHDNSKRWTVDHKQKTIHALTCLHMVEIDEGGPLAAVIPPKERPTCKNCHQLLVDRGFCIALNRKGSDVPTHTKYVNKIYLDRYNEVEGLLQLIEAVRRIGVIYMT